jgi:hypothetical protein
MPAPTIETVGKLKFVLVPHPAYRPEFTASDYHIF